MTNVAAVSLEIGYPTVASVPHSIVNGFKVLYSNVCYNVSIIYYDRISLLLLLLLI